MSFVEAWLPRAAATHPARAAIETPDRIVTYSELVALAGAGARTLLSCGVGPGDRVALAAESDLDFAVALHACLWVGAVAVPVDNRLGPEERAVREAVADHVLDGALAGTGTGDQDRMSLPAGHSSDHLALVVHTSGTTGPGTPVGLTHGNLAAAALGSAVALGLDPAERWLCTLPVSHVGGLSILIRSAIYGTTVMLEPRFDPDRAGRALAGGAATVVSLVPTTLVRLLDAGLRRPPALRRALIGGGPLSPGTRDAALEAGVPVVQTYGLTEACSQVTTARDPEDTTSGPPLPLVRVRVEGANADGGERAVGVGPGDAGEIAVAGPTVAPEAAGPGGWLLTGDLGVIDARGRLTVTGRVSDTIVTGGENVAPAQVEAILLGHPAVADAAVVGRPDAEWGERLVALVVPAGSEPPDASALHAHLSQRLAPFQVPKAFEWKPQLPRTASGKLRRRELR